MFSPAYIKIICDDCGDEITFVLTPDSTFPGVWNDEHLNEKLEAEEWIEKKGEHFCKECSNGRS